MNDPFNDPRQYVDPGSSWDAVGDFAREACPVDNTLERARKLFTDAYGVWVPVRRDPLILDLDGDGIETTSATSGTYFDHDANGFAEGSGWVGRDDGLLVMDRNGDGIINNGRELFGDETILSSGRKASNGFEALAELDGNADGKIDMNDKAYSQLKVWRDSDGDGYSLRTELHTLEELGIKSINLDSTIVNLTDAEGNTRNRIGSFEMMDGTIRQIAEYTFDRDPIYSIPKEWLDAPDDIAALPDLPGYGNVRDLHQAMVRDTTGELKTLVEEFAACTDPRQREALMKEILFKWTGADDVDPDSRGYSMDARKIAMLEGYFDEKWQLIIPPKPPGEWVLRIYGASILLGESYRAVFEMYYAELMAQTHLKDLYDKLVYTWDAEKQDVRTDFSGVIPDLVASLNNNPEQGRQLVSEFARSLRGISSCSPDCYLVFRETMLEIDPDLGWAFDSGGLPVIDGPRQGIGWRLHINGTDGDDAVKGSLTEGDGWINGQYGDDVIYGSDRDEHIYSMDGDSLIVGGGGNDQIWAGAGNDILDGGAGNDTLLGEAGNDTYIFRRGSGRDTIIDYDPTPGNVDTIWLGSHLAPENISLKRAGNNLVLKINDTDDTLTVKDFFRNDGALNRVEQIRFMDGAIWTERDIIERVYAPTEGDDIVYAPAA
jgi:hypothetical protein